MVETTHFFNTTGEGPEAIRVGPHATPLSQHIHGCHGAHELGVGHGQLYGTSLPDAAPSRPSDGMQMAKIQRYVKELTHQKFFLYSMNRGFVT
jgi:hypothetical protein